MYIYFYQLKVRTLLTYPVSFIGLTYQELTVQRHNYYDTQWNLYVGVLIWSCDLVELS